MVAQYRECQAFPAPLVFERLIVWDLPDEVRSEHWLCITISYIGQGENGCARFTFVAEDVSERKQIEQSLKAAQFALHQSERARRKANKRVATILDSIHDAYIALDRDGIITYTNGRAEDLLRRPRAEFLGQNFFDAFTTLRDMRIHEEIQRALSRQADIHFDDYYPISDRWIEVNIYSAQEGFSFMPAT